MSLIDVDGASRALMLCPFRLCDWQSEDVRVLTLAEQDAVARWHMLDAHREQIAALAELQGAPAAVCARPHPTERGRFCLEPRHHLETSHGDGRVDRWLLR